MPKKSKDFEERENLLKLKLKIDKEKHKMKMKELEFFKETQIMMHKKELERQRIKSAEIRKMQERKNISRVYHG